MNKNHFKLKIFYQLFTFNIGELHFTNSTRENGRFSCVSTSVDVESTPLVVLHRTEVALDDLIVHTVLRRIWVLITSVFGILFLGSRFHWCRFFQHQRFHL